MNSVAPASAALIDRPLIYYSPHQDDETLWAGQILAHHRLVGRPVIAVLATDGSTSTIRSALNGEENNGWWRGWHTPARDRTPYMSPEDFAAARDREMLRACAQLDIAPEFVHLRHGERRPYISLDEAEALVLAYEAAYPGAGHWTTWWGDTDPTHATLGTAVRNLRRAGKITDARWVVRRAQASSAPGAVHYDAGTHAEQCRRMAWRACLAYGAWAPPEAYAIGMHSVPSEFEWAMSGAPNVVVRTY
ncbi:PIG-L family deacetylase [Streptomyces sp. DH12]|uniref:PIG-L family deacetylase n=1 Tax=Streptomyces sp. DH12 TaxID=2857010 RepID=UPI001E45FB28|nr:PIG-L family deacetylase [Streptomyces sp. DH12]